VADPVGIRRPDPADLLELDGYDDMFADALADIRAVAAAARDRVSLWEPLPWLPETRQHPVTASVASGRGASRRRRWHR
jgi:hypothetical protein